MEQQNNALFTNDQNFSNIEQTLHSGNEDITDRNTPSVADIQYTQDKVYK